jgi:type I restriction enzyme S subunit
MAGWQSQPLEECIERVKYDSKIPRSEFLEVGLYPIVSQEADFINGFWDKKTDLFKADCPVVVFGDHTQVLKYIDFDFVIGADGVKILKPKPFLHPKYLYYFLKSVRLKRLGYARHYRLLAKLSVNYAPLPEQKRIVAILDEAFEGIDTAVANAEKNLASARELFDSYLKSVFTKKGKGWVKRKLGDICENLDSRRVPITKSDRSKGDVPYYGASGIVDYVSGYLFDEDILLISEDGANLLARSYPIAFSVSGKSWVNNHAHVVRFSCSDNQKIVELYLNSISLTPYVSGMAQPKLNQKSLNAIIIPIPPIAEQAHIVEAAKTLQAGIERLEAIYQEKLKALADLKHALLQKAFAGELTARSAEAVQEAAE